MSRYIDADKLKEVFDEHEDDYGYLHGYWEEFIDNAPTADVRENVRGEWISTGFMEVKCSNCKETFHELESANFCPNCGADMRGDNQ
jgi:hypothetical protein